MTCDDFRIAAGPTVAELLRVGDIVTTSYNTGPYAVVEIRPQQHVHHPLCYNGMYGCKSKGAPLAFNLVVRHLSPRGDGRPSFINHLVAVDGRLLNAWRPDEVFIEQQRELFR